MTPPQCAFITLCRWQSAAVTITLPHRHFLRRKYSMDSIHCFWLSPTSRRLFPFLKTLISSRSPGASPGRNEVGWVPTCRDLRRVCSRRSFPVIWTENGGRLAAGQNVRDILKHSCASPFLLSCLSCLSCWLLFNFTDLFLNWNFIFYFPSSRFSRYFITRCIFVWAVQACVCWAVVVDVHQYYKQIYVTVLGTGDVGGTEQEVLVLSLISH